MTLEHFQEIEFDPHASIVDESCTTNFKHLLRKKSNIDITSNKGNKRENSRQPKKREINEGKITKEVKGEKDYLV